jgi:hypothetical protein
MYCTSGEHITYRVARKAWHLTANKMHADTVLRIVSYELLFQNERRTGADEHAARTAFLALLLILTLYVF